jgi:aspartyl-tRNA(Asn)/glutamyl-tRNA(Gln) amidotransferase subunit A
VAGSPAEADIRGLPTATIEALVTNATDVCFLSALELGTLYRSRKLSPVEVATAVLERIGALNPRYTAFITVTAERAMDGARASEARYGNRGELGPLDGVPISIKDLMPTKGIRTTRGSLLDPDWVPDFDPPFMDRVYAAGMVMLGKTNTPELGWKADSGNRIVGPTHNPWQYERTAGGSSGGAGAAVALGMGPIGQGSDGGGSIRIPASFCGIYGFKPSAGLVPQYPTSPFGDLSHLGPMTRTVRDSALLVDATAGADPRDRQSWSSGVDYLTACDRGVKGLRAGWLPAPNGRRIAPGVGRATAEAAARFRDLGVKVEETDFDVPDPTPVWVKLWAAGSAAIHRHDLDRVRSLLDPGRIPLIESGLKLSGSEVAELSLLRANYYHAIRRFMEAYDFLLLPTCARTAFDAGADTPTEVDGHPLGERWDWLFTPPVNLTGHPAANLPCGFDENGLPVGLQVIGRWHDDATVFAVSAAFEAASPWANHRPAVD